jgi:hypothetical protein
MIALREGGVATNHESVQTLLELLQSRVKL